MAFGLGPLAALDIAAGVFVAAVGAFVLAARPHATTHRVFFLFAVFDGIQTILFRARTLDLPQDVALIAQGAYWWFQIGVLAMLVSLGVIFPRPWGSQRGARTVLWAVVGAAAAVLAVYAFRHDLFWVAQVRDGSLSFATRDGSRYVTATYGIVTAALLARMVWFLRHDPSESHREQAGLVMGAIALGYAPAATTLLAQALRTDPSSIVRSFPVALAYASFAAVVVMTVVSAIEAAREKGPARRVLLASMLAILLLTLVGALGLASADALQILAVAAYPALLGHAILRYAVFDIDARLRTIAIVSMVGVGITSVFIVSEGVLQAFLQERVLTGLPFGPLAGSVAGLLAALAVVPLARLARRLAERIVPSPEEDELHRRKVAIYRHAVATLAKDGLTPKEREVLGSLRASLGLSDAEGERALVEAAA